MTYICLYFQVHQPKRLRNYTVFDMHNNHYYADDKKNRDIVCKVANKCYLPANKILHDLINRYGKDFKIAFSITGTVIEQFKKYSPETLDSFKRLAETGCVEFLNETYYHSLCFLFSKEEFQRQVNLHKELIKTEFQQEAKTFRHTEFIYNNTLADCVEKMGYTTILAEGAEKVLGCRSPNYLYKPHSTKKLKLLLKNHRLSDDIAFRFSNQNWAGYPLTSHKFADWIHNLSHDADIINLFMDYETFGEHQWADKGIFEFLQTLPKHIFKYPDLSFCTPQEASQLLSSVAHLDAPEFYSWADTERDLSAWLGNDLQEDAIHTLYAMEKLVHQINIPELTHKWRNLQTSDHFYYMCTKWHADGNVHKYFNPYDDPYDAYINYQNVLADLMGVLQEKL